MGNYRLYGDAKANAREADGQRKQKMLAAAQERFAKDPSPKVQAEVASALFDAGRYEDAEKHFTELLDNHGDDPDILFELGFIYKNLGRNDDAVKTFSRIIELDPRHNLARGAENEIWRIDPEYKPSWLRK